MLPLFNPHFRFSGQPTDIYLQFNLRTYTFPCRVQMPYRSGVIDPPVVRAVLAGRFSCTTWLAREGLCIMLCMALIELAPLTPHEFASPRDD